MAVQIQPDLQHRYTHTAHSEQHNKTNKSHKDTHSLPATPGIPFSLTMTIGIEVKLRVLIPSVT